jgi:hypothetical protein
MEKFESQILKGKVISITSADDRYVAVYAKKSWKADGKTDPYLIVPVVCWAVVQISGGKTEVVPMILLQGCLGLNWTFSIPRTICLGVYSKERLPNDEELARLAISTMENEAEEVINPEPD